MEIERKFLIKELPFDLSSYEKQIIAQSYISTDPVIRIRQKNDTYVLEVKGKGSFAREEYALDLTREQYEGLKKKAEGLEIKKTRYLIPLSGGLVAELDIYCGHLSGFMNVEVEFKTQEEGLNFIPPDWFGEDVTYEKKYKNSYLSTQKNY